MKKATAKTKRNNEKSQRKSLVSRLSEKRRNRRDSARNARQERVVAAVEQAPRHLRPLMIDATAVGTAGLATLDPTVGLIAGGVGAAGVAIDTGMSQFTEAQRRISYTHLAGAAAWALAAWKIGLDMTPLWVAGGVGAIAAQSCWTQARGGGQSKTAQRVPRSLAETWNDEETGVLAKAGATGARMVGHSRIRNTDGLEIGDSYTIDLSGSSVVQSTFCARGESLAHYMPGKVRPKSVAAIPDRENQKRVTLRHIWVSPWKSIADDPNRETVVTHPIAKVLPQLSEVMVSAAERHDDPEAANKPIPLHVAEWLPGARTFADPAWIGEKEDRGSYYKGNYYKGNGVRHGKFIASSGGGKTSLINAEIASCAPCQDVLIWYADVSTKRGVDVKPWGGVLDWFVDTPQGLKAMLKAAERIMEVRSQAYEHLGGLRTPAQCPTIKIIIDEITQTFDKIEDLIDLLKPIVTQGRAQGVQIEVYGQSGSSQGVEMRGWQALQTAGITQNGALKVNDHRALGYALDHPDEVPYDMTTAPEGVLAFEPHGAAVADVLRVGHIDQGDPDEGKPGLIPAIAAIYAPWRPKMDAPSAAQAGEEYHARPTSTVDNPFLTPTEIEISHAPVHPVTTDDDLARDRERVTTANEWVEALMRGETMQFADLARVIEDNMPPGNTEEERRERRAAVAEDRATEVAERDVELDALAERSAARDDAVQTSAFAPREYDDSDEITAVAVRMLRQNAKRGITNSELRAELGGDLDRRTVERRLRALQNDGRAVRTGTTRDARWYDANHAPAGV